MDKTAVFSAVLARMREELELRRGAAEAARAEATNEQSKSENKYDTRGLEASYLARGHALSTAELESDLEVLRSLVLSPHSSGQGVGLGSLVETRIAGGSDWYFLLPCGGGREIESGGAKVTVITPSTPMGQKLGSLREGSSFPLRPGMSPGVVKRVL